MTCGSNLYAWSYKTRQPCLQYLTSSVAIFGDKNYKEPLRLVSRSRSRNRSRKSAYDQSATYVIEKKKIVSNSRQQTFFRACSYNQKSNTKISCTCVLLVCKFLALNFYRRFNTFNTGLCGGFQARFIYEEFQSRKNNV